VVTNPDNLPRFTVKAQDITVDSNGRHRADGVAERSRLTSRCLKGDDAALSHRIHVSGGPLCLRDVNRLHVRVVSC
jgi:hypothetical protein